MLERYFEEIMADIVGDDPKGIRHLKEALESSQESVTVRSLQRYLRGDSVPSFEVAKNIIKTGKIKYSDDEIREILRLSRAVGKERKQEQKLIKARFDKHIIIDADNFRIGDMNGEYVLDYLEDRINELYGKKTSSRYSLYIKDLILADLKKGILSNEEH